MRGVIPPLLQYVFMAWCLGTGITLPLPLPISMHRKHRTRSSKKLILFSPFFKLKRQNNTNTTGKARTLPVFI
jgi:hypothetical protein